MVRTPGPVDTLYMELQKRRQNDFRGSFVCVLLLVEEKPAVEVFCVCVCVGRRVR